MRLNLSEGAVHAGTAGSARLLFDRILDDLTEFGDGGARLPSLKLLVDGRIVSFAGLTRRDHILALADTELATTPAQTPIALLAQAGGQ